VNGSRFAPGGILVINSEIVAAKRSPDLAVVSADRVMQKLDQCLQGIEE